MPDPEAALIRVARAALDLAARPHLRIRVLAYLLKGKTDGR